MIVSARRRLAARRPGFTLLEVLVVVAILVILAGVAGVAVFGFLDDSKLSTAQSQCKTLEDACRAFKLKPAANGAYPVNLQQLVLPQDSGLNMTPTVEGGMSGITDPWGNLYQLTTANFQGQEVPVVYSNGPPDGQPIYSRAYLSMQNR